MLFKLPSFAPKKKMIPAGAARLTQSHAKEPECSNRNASLIQEVAFWKSLATGTFPNQEWCDEFPKRIAGQLPFPKYLLPHLDSRMTHIRVLDVGAGPHTSLGSHAPGFDMEITAVDPLASEYDNMFAELGMKPFIRTIPGTAEALCAQFGERTFDIVYSKNAMDHVVDPLPCILELVKVCKRNGIVYIEGQVNEGEHQGYNQLHQWNFLPCESDLVIWNRKTSISLAKRLDGQAAVRATGTDWYRVLIRPI